jgi:hypothetical protein
MNEVQTIIVCMQQAIRGEPIDSDIFLPAMTATIASPDVHELGCAMLKALIEHHQSDLKTRRALLLVQAGRSDHA